MWVQVEPDSVDQGLRGPPREGAGGAAEPRGCEHFRSVIVVLVTPGAPQLLALDRHTALKKHLTVA